MVPFCHGPQTVSSVLSGSTTWIEQPRALVEVVPPVLENVSVPTVARASTNAARASLLAMTACRCALAQRFHATAHAAGEGDAPAETTGAKASETPAAAKIDRMLGEYDSIRWPEPSSRYAPVVRRRSRGEEAWTDSRAVACAAMFE
jgi:nucleoid-associated protein YgaU